MKTFLVNKHTHTNTLGDFARRHTNMHLNPQIHIHADLKEACSEAHKLKYSIWVDWEKCNAKLLMQCFWPKTVGSLLIHYWHYVPANHFYQELFLTAKKLLLVFVLVVFSWKLIALNKVLISEIQVCFVLCKACTAEEKHQTIVKNLIGHFS